MMGLFQGYIHIDEYYTQFVKELSFRLLGIVLFDQMIDLWHSDLLSREDSHLL